MECYNSLHFESVSDAYDEVRPDYPAALFERIHAFCSVRSIGKILEIGCGSGKATKVLAQRWNCPIVAIEPGRELLKIAQGAVKEFPNVNLKESTFEDFEKSCIEKFDLIVSATSFHWLDPRTKYGKCSRLLSQNGFLAVFWTNFVIADELVGLEVDQIYETHSKRVSGSKTLPIDRAMRKIEARRQEIRDSGFFQLAESHVDEFEVKYSANSFLKLIQTFPDHSEVNFYQFDAMLKKIESVIKTNGDSILIHVILNTELAIQPNRGFNLT